MPLFIRRVASTLKTVHSIAKNVFHMYMFQVFQIYLCIHLYFLALLSVCLGCRTCSVSPGHAYGQARYGPCRNPRCGAGRPIRGVSGSGSNFLLPNELPPATMLSVTNTGRHSRSNRRDLVRSSPTQSRIHSTFVTGSNPRRSEVVVV